MLDIPTMQREFLPQLEGLMLRVLDLYDDSLTEEQHQAVITIEAGVQRSLQVVSMAVPQDELVTVYSELRNALSKASGVVYLLLTDPDLVDLHWDDQRRSDLVLIHQTAEQMCAQL